MSKIFVKQQRTLQDFGFEPSNVIPTIPYDPSQLTPGIKASLQNRSDSNRNAPVNENFQFSDIQPANLQEYMDMLHDEYYKNVTAYSNPQELADIQTELENARNQVMRQLSNQTGYYGPNGQFYLFSRQKVPKGYGKTNASNTPEPLPFDLDAEQFQETPAEFNSLPGTYDERFANVMDSFKRKDKDKLMSSRDFFYNLVRRYGAGGATYILRNHPAFKINRQRSLAEVIPGYQTENPFNPDGSIKPGAVPPVTAVKQMSAKDIERLLLGAGLMPIGSQVDAKNLGYETDQVLPQALDPFDTIRNEHTQEIGKLRKPFIMGAHNTEIPGGTQAGSFVSPVVREDVARAIVASHRDGPRRMLGIRGLNPIDDFLQQRASTGQHESTAEGYISSRIDPSRLVPIEIPKGSIPATVRGDVKIDDRNPNPSQEQRVAAILRGYDGFKPGVTRNTISPRLDRKGLLDDKKLSLESLFNLSQDGFLNNMSNIQTFVNRNERRLESNKESLNAARKHLKDLNSLTNQIVNPAELVRHEDKIEDLEFTIDDLESEKEELENNLKHLKSRKDNNIQDHHEAVRQYADALRSVDTQLPFFTDMPLHGIDLTDRLAEITRQVGGTNELSERSKLNFNLDKDGFPLNEDGSAMTLNEKIDLVTDPDLEVLAENIFDNRRKVIDQIRHYNTKLPFGDDTPTKRRIRPDEVEDTINRMKNIMRINSDAYRNYRDKRYDKIGFQNYLANLRRRYSNAR